MDYQKMGMLEDELPMQPIEMCCRNFSRRVQFLRLGFQI